MNRSWSPYDFHLISYFSVPASTAQRFALRGAHLHLSKGCEGGETPTIGACEAKPRHGTWPTESWRHMRLSYVWPTEHIFENFEKQLACIQWLTNHFSKSKIIDPDPDPSGCCGLVDPWEWEEKPPIWDCQNRGKCSKCSMCVVVSRFI